MHHEFQAEEIDVRIHVIAGPGSTEVSRKSLLWRDEYVALYAEFSDGRKPQPIAFHFLCNRKKRTPLVKVGAWFATTFFRPQGQVYLEGRPYKTVFQLHGIVLVRYGTEDCDYLLTTMHPKDGLRESDPRFSTIPRPHPIESPQQ